MACMLFGDKETGRENDSLQFMIILSILAIQKVVACLSPRDCIGPPLAIRHAWGAHSSAHRRRSHSEDGRHVPYRLLARIAQQVFRCD